MPQYKVFILIFLIPVLLLLNSCSNEQADVLLVATSADNPPYEHVTKGKIVGFDIDIINEIGRILDKKIKFKNVDFNGLLAALSTNNVNMAIAGISVTDERKIKMDFSVPYSSAKVAVLYRKDDNFNSQTDLTDKVVGASMGTIWTFIAKEMSLEHKFSTKFLYNNLILVKELQNQRIDAVIMEESQVADFIKVNPQLASFSVDEYSSSFAIAIPKGSNLKKDIDNAIIQLQNDGTITRLAKKWGIVSAH